MIRKIITILALTSLCSLAQAASQADYTIFPSYSHGDNKTWIIASIKPGDTYKDAVTVQNLSDKEQTISLIYREAETFDSKFRSIESTEFKDIGQWTKLETESLTLKPFEKKQITLTIKIPEQAIEKLYTGVIYAIREYKGTNSLNIVTRIGVRNYITVKNYLLTTNIFNTPAYKSTFFLIFSIIAVLGSIGYNLIYYIENRKQNEKRNN